MHTSQSVGGHQACETSSGADTEAWQRVVSQSRVMLWLCASTSELQRGWITVTHGRSASVRPRHR